MNEPTLDALTYRLDRVRHKRIHDFRKAWSPACRKAGVPGKLRHDFRRPAVRNAVFDRSHIVSPADLQEVARKLSGIISGTIRR